MPCLSWGSLQRSFSVPTASAWGSLQRRYTQCPTTLCLGLTAEEALNAHNQCLGLTAEEALNAHNQCLGLTAEEALNAHNQCLGLNVEEALNAYDQCLGLAAEEAHVPTNEAHVHTLATMSPSIVWCKPHPVNILKCCGQTTYGEQRGVSHLVLPRYISCFKTNTKSYSKTSDKGTWIRATSIQKGTLKLLITPEK